jgi:PAS domain S-box-containing protein
VSDCTVEQSEAKAAVFDATPQAIVAIDGEGRIICWNAAAQGTFGYKRIEAIGQSLAELIIPARLRERHLWGVSSVRRGVAQPPRGPIQTWARRSDDSEFPVAISISTVRLNGAPAFVAHVHDLSNKRRNEAEPTAATSGSTAAGPLLPVRRRSAKPPGD